MNKAHKKVNIVCGALGVLLFMPMFFVTAATNSITNTVSSSVRSGGNSAQGGEVVEGTMSATVFIKTVVDGKVVEFINKHTDNAGEGKEFNTFYKDETVEVTTKGEAGANNPNLEPGGGALTGEIINNTEENTPNEVVDESVGIFTETKFSFIRFFSQMMAYVFNIFTK